MVVDWPSLALSPQDRALCAFAEKLTMAPAGMEKADIEALKATGLDETAIHDAVQVIGYFNYINRIADALGVEPEPQVRAWEKF